MVNLMAIYKVPLKLFLIRALLVLLEPFFWLYDKITRKND